MSSVSSSDRKSHTDELRSQREEYQNREAEQTKKQKKELRRMAERQQEELEEIKQGFNQQLDTLRKRSAESLNNRDVENQKKIEELRGMYMESLRKKTEDSQERNDIEVQTYRDQMAKQKQINEQQKEILKRDFTNSIKERENQFENYSTTARKDLMDGLQKQANKLNQKHDTEMGAVITDRDERIARADRNFQDSKVSYENRLRDQKRQTDARFHQNDQNWRGVYDGKVAEMEDLLAGKSQELAYEEKRQQGKFKRATEEKLQSLDNAYASLKDQAQERIDRDVRSLENINRRIKNDNMVEMMTTKRLRDLEREHVVLAYEDRMRNLTAQKDGVIEVAKDVNRRKIQQVNEKNAEIFQESNRRAHTNQIISNERHKQDRDRLEIEHKSQIQQVGDRTDDRINKVLKATTDAQRMEQKQHKDNVGALKNAYAEELSHQRMSQMEQLKETNIRMEQRVRDQETKLSRKLEETKANYEQQIADLNDKFQSEFSKQAQTTELRDKSREKSFQNELKSAEIKSELKLKQVQEAHEKEVDRLDKRHQEEMQQLAQKLNYYRKKS